jgi:hypothetical protein
LISFGRQSLPNISVSNSYRHSLKCILSTFTKLGKSETEIDRPLKSHVSFLYSAIYLYSLTLLGVSRNHSGEIKEQLIQCSLEEQHLLLRIKIHGLSDMSPTLLSLYYGTTPGLRGGRWRLRGLLLYRQLDNLVFNTGLAS